MISVQMLSMKSLSCEVTSTIISEETALEVTYCWSHSTPSRSCRGHTHTHTGIEQAGKTFSQISRISTSDTQTSCFDECGSRFTSYNYNYSYSYSYSYCYRKRCQLPGGWSAHQAAARAALGRGRRRWRCASSSPRSESPEPPRGASERILPGVMFG